MKKVLVFAILCLAALQGFSQSSERLSRLIESPEITNAQASYLAASYLGLITEDASDSDAFNQLVQQNYFKAGVKENDPITFDTLSYIYTKALKVRGGIFYSLIPSKRYAFNELKAQGILPADCDPQTTVNGRDSIAMFTGCIELKDKSK